jgi:hypothetical protein
MTSSVLHSRRGCVAAILLVAVTLLMFFPGSFASAGNSNHLQYYCTAKCIGAGGYVNPSAAVVQRNDSLTLTIYPDDHVYIKQIIDTGKTMKVSNPYVIPKVQYCHDVTIVLATIQYTVAASVTGGHGRVNPASQQVIESGSASIDLVPDTGYHVASIVDNGQPQEYADPYYIPYIYENHAVVVTFTDLWTVNASVSGSHGTVSPLQQTVVNGGTASVNITPDTHYQVSSISDNGVVVPVANPYVITGVAADHDVRVTFAVIERTVTASVSGGHGTAAPASQQVNDGNSAAVDLTPDMGYHVATIADNGEARPVADPYVIQNVTADHDVVVTFAINQYSISATVDGGHGAAAPVSPTVDYGSPATVLITPEPGYTCATITDNGQFETVTSPYNILSVTSDHHVVVTFKLADLMVSAVAAGGHGTVSPATQIVTFHGNAQAIVMMPEAGYHIATVTDNGVVKPATSPYQLNDVTADHAVTATFEADSYHITAGVIGPGGTVDPADQAVALGGTGVVNIHPGAGYHIEHIIDNGAFVAVASPYVITSVTVAHDVSVIFDVDEFTVDASVAGGHGSVSPTTQTVDYGGSAAVDLTPEAGYHLTAIVDNGVAMLPTDPYVIENVTTGHTVTAVFTTDRYEVHAALDGGHGTVDPAVQAVTSGGNAVVNISTDPGYHVAYIADNGEFMPVSDPYVVTDVTTQHDITVGVAIDVYAVKAAAAGGNGTVGPPEQSVVRGDTAVVDMTPDEGYHPASIIDNGDGMPVTSPYFIDDVTDDHSVTVSFAWDQSSTFYLAEGSTAHGFSTYISIENPNADSLNAKVTYMLDDGTTKAQDVGLPALSQVTVNPKDAVGEDDFSTRVTCLQGKSIAVDRTMTWTGPGAPSPEAHSSIGVTSPDTTWYLPEGCSGYGFETWTLVENPNDQQTAISLTYMIEGKGPKTIERTVPAHSRTTWSMEADVGRQNASVEVGSALPVVAESAVYRDHRREGSDSVGANTASDSFYLAEGSTAWGFTTWVLVQNPNDEAATVTLTCLTANGAKTLAPFTMAPGTRSTVRMNDCIGGTDFSTVVRSDLPVVAERSMYWGEGTPAGEACHASIGLDEPHQTLYLPDGQTSDGRQTYTLVANPNSTAVKVMVTYLASDGTGASYFIAQIPPYARATYDMSDRLPSGRAAIAVVCLTSGRKILAERSMYWNNRGAGTNTVGDWSH